MQFLSKWTGATMAAVAPATEEHVKVTASVPMIIISHAVWHKASGQPYRTDLVSYRAEINDSCKLIVGDTFLLPGPVTASPERGQHALSEPIALNAQEFIVFFGTNLASAPADLVVVEEYLELSEDELKEYRASADFRKAVAERLSLLRSRG